MVARGAAHATTVAVMPNRDLKLLDAADRAATDRRTAGCCMSRRCESPCNQSARTISEGFGRGKGRDRDRPLEIARGETEETIRHLSANFRTNRIAPKDYWPRHNLLVVIAKMLTSLLGD